MPYITDDYYYSIYKGESVDVADFPSLCARASEIIEDMTMYRLSESIFVSMAPEVQEHIKKAICAQIEYLDANGGSDLDMGASMQSASLGRFSYSAGGTGFSQSIYAPRAQRILAPTGLLYRGR